jgi:hypothetical protein
MYTLWYINIDPGSRRGWKTSETTINWSCSGSVLIYQRVYFHVFLIATFDYRRVNTEKNIEGSSPL